MPISVLERELYDVELAADVLKMSSSTLMWWLDGGPRRGKVYAPVIREEATGSKIVTWGELVEARYLQGYRRELGVRLAELRAWIRETRSEMGVPYPLAHERPWVGEGRRLMAQAQQSAGLPEDLWAMWVAQSGQILLTPPAESFLERVDFEDDTAVRIHPAGRESPIVIDPDIRFGTATVRGIPTTAIADQVWAGDPIEMVAADFDLELSEAVAVLSYELRSTSPAAA